MAQIKTPEEIMDARVDELLRTKTVLTSSDWRELILHVAKTYHAQIQQPIPSDIIAFRDAEAEKRWPFYTDDEMLKYNSEIEEERERFKKAFDLCHSTYVVPLQEELKKETECVQFMKDVSDDQVKRIAELEAENKELKKANL